jgi:hypothetical protein
MQHILPLRQVAGRIIETTSDQGTDIAVHGRPVSRVRLHPDGYEVLNLAASHRRVVPSEWGALELARRVARMLAT